MNQIYLKTAIRNIVRHKVFSVINIAGLALGIAVFLLMSEYVASEWRTNRFQKNFEELYRLNIASKKGTPDAYVMPGLAPLLKEKFPAIQSSVRVAEGIGEGVVSTKGNGAEEKTFREDKISYVDGDFLQVFSFPLVTGTASLRQPQTLALTESMANKLFGTNNAVGKLLTISNQFGNTPYTVACVIKDMSQESDIKAQILLSIHTLENVSNRDDNEWANPATLESGFANIYVTLAQGTDVAGLSKQLNTYLHTLKPNATDESIVLQPFKYLHLGAGFNYPFQTFGSFTLVAMLLSIAVLILLIAWVNYINLSTVQALKRAKESGIRKVLGASRKQLATQFLFETFLVTIISVVIALLMVQILQPFYNNFIGKNLSLSVLNMGWFWLAAMIFIVVGALISGGYVAFILSSFKPIATLKGKVGNAVKGISLRKSLVVFQFSISIIFIIGTIVLYKQLKYMKTEKLGMNLQQLLVIKGPTVTSDGQAKRNVAFKESLGQLSFVHKYAASNNVPGIGYNFSTQGITKQNPVTGDDKKSYSMFISDDQFFDTYGIDFLQGKTYTAADVAIGWSKAQKVILNEKAALQLGFSLKENLIGKKILWGKEYEIVGLIKDYHHLSLRQDIEPVIYLPSVAYGYFTMQTDASNMEGKLASISSLYKTNFPGNPFEYFFADENYGQQYASEQQLGSLFIAAAGVSIFIACMGLFGLAAFSAQQRIKEIGVRKVLGASVTDIAALLSMDFVKLVLIAIVIASPIAWWATHKWLADFAYRTSIGWGIFAAAGCTAILIAVLTISFQAIKAAVANPVKSLRTE